MTTQLLNFASALSYRITQQVVATQRRVDARAGQAMAAERVRDRADALRHEQENQARAARTALARTGLARLLAAGMSKQIQGLITSIGRTMSEPSLVFYEAERYFDSAWLAWQDGDFDHAAHIGSTCMMRLELQRNCVFVTYGVNSPHWVGHTWKLFYTPPPNAAVLKGGSEGEEKCSRPVEDFFAEICTTKPSRMSLVRRFDQRRDDWEPADIVFQLLVDCAQPCRFSYYMGDCLKRLERAV